MTPYALKADPAARIGQVSGRTVTSYVVDIEAHVSEVTIGDADEIILRVNGRPLKRMSIGQARRSGIVTEDAR
jgi:hypothetical protein